MMQEIRITEREAGQRLDKFLGKYMKRAPKSFFYKMLRKKNIVLNGKRADGSEHLEEGDQIRLYLSEETIRNFTENQEQAETPAGKKDKKPPFEVIYEDGDILILNKPSGILSQKAGSQDVSLNEMMIQWLLASGRITPEQMRLQRPAVCNRLDRNTSGIVLAGITLKGLQGLSRILRERTGKKLYYALVWGRVERPVHRAGFLKKGTGNQVEILLEAEKETAVDAAGGAVSAAGDDGQYFETAYRPLGYGGGCTLLEVHLITGRSHQIRAHLGSVGHWMIGDPKYGRPDINERFRQKYGLKGQLLHAAVFEMPEKQCPFPALSGRRFTATPEKKFSSVLEGLGISWYRECGPENGGDTKQ